MTIFRSIDSQIIQLVGVLSDTRSPRKSRFVIFIKPNVPCMDFRYHLFFVVNLGTDHVE